MDLKYSRYNIIKEHDNYRVLYNSYTKSSLIFDKEDDLSFIENEDTINNLDEDIKNEFIEQGFVIDKNRDEFEELKYGFLKKYFDKSMLTIALIPTLNCNFSCPYCCEKPFSCGKEDLSKYFKTLKKFSEKQFKLYKHIHINLFGGEPLIYYEHAKDYLEWIDDYSKENNFSYTTGMITNGALITEDKLDFLIDHNISLLQITLDSDKENHDKMRTFKNGKPSFDILIKNIELVSKKFTKENQLCLIRINLNNTTVSKVKKSLENIKPQLRHNINLMYRVIYNTATYKENNTNKMDKLEEYVKMGKNLGFNIYTENYLLQSCEAVNDCRVFYILPNLTMSKCASEIGHPAGIFGKIKSNGEVDLDSEKLVNWFEANFEAFNNEKCKNCKLMPDCLGGCPLFKIKNGVRSCRSFDMVSLPNYYGELDE